MICLSRLESFPTLNSDIITTQFGTVSNLERCQTWNGVSCQTQRSSYSRCLKMFKYDIETIASPSGSKHDPEFRSKSASLIGLVGNKTFILLTTHIHSDNNPKIYKPLHASFLKSCVFQDRFANLICPSQIRKWFPPKI